MDFFSRPDVHSQTSTCIYSLPIPFFIFTFFEMFKTSFILMKKYMLMLNTKERYFKTLSACIAPTFLEVRSWLQRSKCVTNTFN